MDPGQGGGSQRRSRGADASGRRDDGQEPAVDAGLVHGPDAAYDRQRNGARIVHRPARAGQRGRFRRRCQHLPRPRQRSRCHRYRPQSRLAARLLRSRNRRLEAFCGGLGRRLRMDQEAVRVARDDGKVGHDGIALDRRRPGEERADRPGQQSARADLLGPCAEQPDARQGNDRGDEKARHAGGDRSVSVGDGGDGGDGAQGRRLSVAGVYAVRDLRVRHRIEPVAAVAREGDRADVRVEARPDH